MSARSKASPHVNEGDLPASRALIPLVTKVDEQRVEEGFWPKVRKVAGKIPFLPDALALWWCAKDPETPVAARGMMMAALAYFVLPTDVIPDVLAGVGFTDDAAVIAAVIGVVGKHLKPRHRDAAEAFIRGETRPAAPAR
jgi:uncharacterized membrane protein YkvA (DUF1232 family)